MVAVFSEELSSWGGPPYLWLDRFPADSTTPSSPVSGPAAQTFSPVPVATKATTPNLEPRRRDALALQLQSQPFQLQPQLKRHADEAKKRLARELFLGKDTRREATPDNLGHISITGESPETRPGTSMMSVESNQRRASGSSILPDSPVNVSAFLSRFHTLSLASVHSSETNQPYSSPWTHPQRYPLHLRTQSPKP